MAVRTGGAGGGAGGEEGRGGAAAGCGGEAHRAGLEAPASVGLWFRTNSGPFNQASNLRCSAPARTATVNGHRRRRA